jgi:hypothetical protein
MSQIVDAGRLGRDVAPCFDWLECFGWEVGDGKWSDSGAERLAKRRKAAERRSQASNGSAARMRELNRRDERALCGVERAWSRGVRWGDRKPWSEATRALVTAARRGFASRRRSGKSLGDFGLALRCGKVKRRDGTESAGVESAAKRQTEAGASALRTCPPGRAGAD